MAVPSVDRIVDRVARSPWLWFALAMGASCVQAHFAPPGPLSGLLAIPFTAALFAGRRGVLATAAGHLIVLVAYAVPVRFAGPALAGLVAEGLVVAWLAPSRERRRFDQLEDVYVLLGLVLAATACRMAVVMPAAFVVGEPVAVAGLALLGSNPFAILVFAPVWLVATQRRQDFESAVGPVESVLVAVLGIAATYFAYASGISLLRPVPTPAVALVVLPMVWIAIRFELIGAATATFAVVLELVVLALVAEDWRPFVDREMGMYQHQIVLLLAATLLACNLLIAAIARSQRVQRRESLVLVAALRQKAERMAALNDKLTIQTEQLRRQSEQLLVQYAELEDANGRLASQQAWMDAVYASMPVGLYIVDKSERLLDRKHARPMVPGLDHGLPSGRIADLSAQYDVRRLDDSPFEVDDWPIIRAVRQGERTVNEPLKLRQPDGSWRVLSVNAGPILDRDGAITGAVALTVDVTALHDATRSIELVNRRVQFALQSAKAIVWERDIHCGMNYRTSSMAEWLGYPLEAGFDNLDVYFGHMHPDDRDRGLDEFRRFTARVGVFASEYRMVHRDGHVVWVLTRGETLAGDDGRPARIVGAHFDITAQKETEAKLRFLESAIVHTRDAVVLIDAHAAPNAGRQVLYVNDAFVRMSGYARADVVGRSLNVLRGPDSDPETLERIRTALDGGHSFQTEILNYRKGGTSYWAELTLEPVRDADGTIQHWVMIQRDITDRRRAADALRRSEEMFRGIFENAWAGVSLTDPTGRFVSANPAFAAMLGMPESEIVGRYSRDVTHPESWAEQAPVARDFVAGRIDRYQIKKRYVRGDGEMFWGELFCNAIRGPGGEFLYGLGVTVDVTERTRLETQLRESEARLRAVYENSAAGVIVVDPEAVIVEVNPAFAKMLGYDPAAMVGLAVSAITHPDDIGPERLKLKELTDGRAENAQVRKRYLHCDGSHVVADLYTRCIRDDGGQVKFRIGIAIDVTERVALEDQLRHAQKMEAVGQMAGGIAHDFNNLLTAILGNLSLARKAASPELPAMLAAAEQAAGRAADLTRKLLGFARRSQLQLAPVDPGEVVTEVVDILRRTLNPLIVIETDLAPTAPIHADPTLLNQVLVNLCLNGRDAMPQGGRLILSVAEVEHDQPPHGLAPGRFANLAVTDTGEGMSAETMARIYEPFFTTKGVGKGTGLGLAMVMGTIRQHGGWVDCTSAPGVGTRFDIYLPLADLPLDAPAGSTDETPVEIEVPRARTGDELVLVVDDEPLVRSLARAVLESDGYTVVESEDGADAVEWVRQHPNRASLILMDVTMPRMSGRDAYDLIAAIDPAARVLFSSGYSAEDISDIITTAGMLAKPYRPGDLLKTVRDAIARG
jgi:PAS domain S-box-containing protein